MLAAKGFERSLATLALEVGTGKQSVIESSARHQSGIRVVPN